MQIDWFTVAAQIVNFLLLVALLKRFLYGPIVRAMEHREQRVTERLREAQERSEEAEREGERHRARTRELDERRERLLEKAREEAEARRRELLAEARAEIEDLRHRWRAELEREQDAFVRALRGQVTAWSVDTLRRALRELAGTSLEERMVEAFVERLRALDVAEQEALARAVDEAGEPVELRSAFPLAEPQREAVRKALEQRLERSVELRFEESAELACGVELRTPGRQISWSLEGFLADLEERIAAALRAQGGAAAEAEGGRNDG